MTIIFGARMNLLYDSGIDDGMLRSWDPHLRPCEQMSLADHPDEWYSLGEVVRSLGWIGLLTLLSSRSAWKTDYDFVLPAIDDLLTIQNACNEFSRPYDNRRIIFSELMLSAAPSFRSSLQYFLAPLVTRYRVANDRGRLDSRILTIEREDFVHLHLHGSGIIFKSPESGLPEPNEYSGHLVHLRW
jgi:hypothetical protein